MMGGGGSKCPPPLSLFVKTIEKEIGLCSVLTFFLSGSFEDRAIFYVMRLSYDGGGPWAVGPYVPITNR